VLGDLVRCTAPFNYLGLPAISVPAGLDDRGLPMGVQLVGVPFSESRLLAAAAVHECALPPPRLAN
jgi:Asp-tRNA(Asn)/Glu-tRNA(Gln) amidotransferase A subunit family amidase